MEKIENGIKEKEYWLTTLILCFFLGALGAHRLYNRKIATGLLQLVTLGGLGIWTLIDLILILLNRFEINKDKKTIEENNIEQSNKDWIITFSLCWTLGIFGVHRFYNKKIGTGILQLITLGGLGIWVLIDLINIANHKFLDKNERKVIKSHKNSKRIIAFCSIILIVTSIYISADLLKVSRELEEAKIENVINEALEKKFGVDLHGMLKLGYSSTINARVFLEYEATEQEVENLAKELNNIDGIYNIEFVSKEQSYNMMVERLGENEKAISNFTPDIFSESYTFEIKNKKDEQEITKIIENLPEVRELSTNLETKKAIKKLTFGILLAIIISEYYKIVTILLILLLVIRTATSICAFYCIYRNKNEFTI